ncbi:MULTISPECIES: beta-N-acetylglucosaminidase domain-containing protein [unclassified Isoptericola]|uniref:beta-N-acetylglucosaminidase domain-containing protein n=1 Tax=unclassified Isoptericola TaxID=2623355 RepID=UPI0036596CBD
MSFEASPETPQPPLPSSPPPAARQVRPPGSRTSRRAGTAVAAAALLATVAGGLAAPGAVAEPAAGSATGSTADAGPADAVFPTPQEATANGDEFPLAGRVTLVVGEDTDESAVAATRRVLADAGAKVAVTVADRADAPVTGKRVYLGAAGDNPAVAGVLQRIGVDGAQDLPADGYVLATGRDAGPVLVLDGHDDTGAFYAAQTLRQLVQADGEVAGVQVRDWPLMEIRGAIEGFYGIPWSHQARLDQLAFYGKHKMNTYVYTPKDDRKLRYEWRDLYEGTELDQLRELVETANRNHVKFTFALSPGNDVCYSSQEDFDATVRKFDQLRDLGVTSFYVALDDIPLELHCDADKERFTAGSWGWLADAQTYYLNRIQREYVVPNGLEPLQTVPTNYAGSGEDPYKSRFGDGLDDDVRVQWTGEGVFSPTVTTASVQKAVRSYRTDHLYIWDNFPVNDGRRNRLFLNPLTGRDPELYRYIDGFTSNPMIEPYASMPSLADYGDYTWNPPAYDADASHANALDELAGADPAVRDALGLFVDLNQHWPYRSGSPKAPGLSADVDAFWAAYDAGDDAGRSALLDRLAAIEELPSALAPMAEPGFVADSTPWIDAASQWASALLAEADMLAALEDDDVATASTRAAAAREQLALAGRATVDDQGSDGVYREDQIVPSVGDGRFEEFSAKAFRIFCAAAPDDASCPVPTLPGTVSTSLPQYSTYTPANMVDGDDATLFWSSRAARAGDEIRYDLDEPAAVKYVAVHMADNDTAPGDMIQHGRIEVSADGSTWTTVGTFDNTPLAEVVLDEPVEASHVRVVATAANASSWVKVRELVVAERTP